MQLPSGPLRRDVVVVGSGPAGSACAWSLARQGLQVLLVDQQAFPRDKACGDGLIPDALVALDRLGVLDEVLQQARQVPHVRCVGPRGGHVDVPGRLAVLPRRQLDHILHRAAVGAGAEPLLPARFESPLRDGERVVGARLQHAGRTIEVAARWLVLATGAAPQAAIAAGVCDRRTPSGVALRGYFRHPALAEAASALEIVWHRRLAGGYGWVFPAPDGVFNVGVGLTGSHVLEGEHGRMRELNLRSLLEAFGQLHARAGRLLSEGEPLGTLKGAPLRCSLAGTRWSCPGLLVTGEAAGSTYAFTGEGIGKAMETGLLAADALGTDSRSTDADTRARYEASLRALQPRFALYQRAEHVNRRPWLADLVIWRARRSPAILRRMSGVLDETQNPGRLLSWRGIGKLLLS
jgi:geranylgeranyl reductase family protein